MNEKEGQEDAHEETLPGPDSKGTRAQPHVLRPNSDQEPQKCE